MADFEYLAWGKSGKLYSRIYLGDKNTKMVSLTISSRSNPRLTGLSMIVLVQSTITSCGMGDNHRGVCFLKDEKTMRVHGVAGKPNDMDISNFPTSYYNPCRRDK